MRFEPKFFLCLNFGIIMFADIDLILKIFIIRFENVSFVFLWDLKLSYETNCGVLKIFFCIL